MGRRKNLKASESFFLNKLLFNLIFQVDLKIIWTSFIVIGTVNAVNMYEVTEQASNYTKNDYISFEMLLSSAKNLIGTMNQEQEKHAMKNDAPASEYRHLDAKTCVTRVSTSASNETFIKTTTGEYFHVVYT